MKWEDLKPFLVNTFLDPPLLLFKGVIVTKVIECKSNYPTMEIKNGQIRTKK